MTEPAIELRNLEKRFGGVQAVDKISLRIAAGEFFALLGPSGCGKTTLLRLIAGLEVPDSGELFVRGRSMLGVPARERPVNTVFQSYALFPHLNVFDNVAFGLRMRKVHRSEIKRRVNDALDLTHTLALHDRFPGELSGGQKQRVALARAVVNQPAVLLLDEPLAAVDAPLRAQLQSDLKKLQRQLRITFLHVTHDQDEALALCDRLAVMQDGRVEQVGPPEEVYAAPRTRFVASFLGGANILKGKVLARAAAHFDVETPAGVLRVIGNPGAPRDEISLMIRPERISLERGSGARENTVEGRVTEVSFTGARTQCTLQVGETTLRASFPNPGPNPRAGEVARVYLPPDALILLED